MWLAFDQRGVRKVTKNTFRKCLKKMLDAYASFPLTLWGHSQIHHKMAMGAMFHHLRSGRAAGQKTVLGWPHGANSSSTTALRESGPFFMLCDQFSLYLKPFPFLVSRISLGRQSQIWENHGMITIHSFILMANIESTFPRNKLSPKTFQSLMQFSVAPIKQSDVTGVWVLNKNPRYNFRVE